MTLGTKKPTTNAKKGVMTSKRKKAQLRVARVHSAILKKKKTRTIARKLRVKAAEARKEAYENIPVEEGTANTPYVAQNSIASEMGLLQAMGLIANGQSNEAILTSKKDNDKWQRLLENRLKELETRSLDNPEVRRVYSEIGRIFATYRSGKIPRAFKIIPNLEEWEGVIKLTNPDKWTPQSMYQAVKIFASNFDATRAQQFYLQFLLPAVRQNLSTNKKLNYHLFEALKKALYKTNAWFKGLLLPLADDPTTLLREAKVFQSLLSKMSIPVINAAVAILKLLQVSKTSTAIRFLRAMVAKGYNLPKRVVSSISEYLLGFSEQESQGAMEAESERGEELGQTGWEEQQGLIRVSWHQLVLSFSQQYGASLSNEVRNRLISLAKHHNHPTITPQIIKALTEVKQ